MHRRALGSAALVAACALAFFVGAPPVVSGVTCDRFAAPGGSDSGAGTLTDPYATAQRLARSLGAGETGCFRSGVYGFDVLNLDRPRITLAPYSAEPVTLRGDIKVLPTGFGARIEGMRLDGSGGKNEIGPRIYADDVVLRGNDITNRHRGICVMLGEYASSSPPEDVIIERNRIHDCGRMPATNHDHGIYLSEARDTIVRDNWIYSNADRGIQQYPDTQGSAITGNVIAHNGQGINFGGDDSGQNCSDGNLVRGNVISHSRLRWNAYSGSQGAACAGNVVRDNCALGTKPGFKVNGGIEPGSRSFSAASNATARPDYRLAPAGDYRLDPASPCLAKYEGTMAAPGGAPPLDLGPARGVLRIQVSRRSVPRGGRVRVRGRAIASRAVEQRRVVIKRQTRGGWRRAGRSRIIGGGRFLARVRLRGGGSRAKLRAQARGVGRSRAVKVRIVRR